MGEEGGGEQLAGEEVEKSAWPTRMTTFSMIVLKASVVRETALPHAALRSGRIGARCPSCFSERAVELQTSTPPQPT